MHLSPLGVAPFGRDLRHRLRGRGRGPGEVRSGESPPAPPVARNGLPGPDDEGTAGQGAAEDRGRHQQAEGGCRSQSLK